MGSTYRDLLATTRSAVREVSLEELKRRLDANEPYVVVDVRENDELAQGKLPGAIAIPRGSLEMQIEAKVPDKKARIVTYCAGGPRGAFAAATLGVLGYENVEAANPGFTRWMELGYPIEKPALTPPQRERYARHVRLAEVGEQGQSKLLAARVLLLGAGGLGSPAALYLAAAGVGTLGIVDHDVVDASNLHRQVLHRLSTIGTPKVESAERAIADLNPDVKVVGHHERLTSENVERLLSAYDLVVDGTDNFTTRYVVNDASVRLGKPVVHGSIARFEGQVTTFVPEKASSHFGINAGPCYRCLFPAPPPPHLAPNCQDAGVLGILCGIIGTLQATEAIKLVLGEGDLLNGRLLMYDSLKLTFREMRFARDPACPACGG